MGVEQYIPAWSAPWLLAAFVLLQIADVATTTIAIRMGGVESAGPMKWAIDRFGLLPGQIALKLGVIAPIVGAWLWFGWGAQAAAGVLVVCIVLYAVVLGNNLRTLRVLREWRRK